MKRQLKLFDILCLGVNGIVGSGIFLIPGRMIGAVGPLSIVHFALCGLLLIFIALCFAEASSYFDRNGGPYNYAQMAFGGPVGFAVGWIAWVAAVFSYAAVASGLPSYMSVWFPGASGGWVSSFISISVILIFGALNYRGVKLGAWTTNVFTIGKMLPLLFLAIAGLFFFNPSHLVPFAPQGWAPMGGLTLAVVFAFQGFEVVPIPAGETRQARSIMPKAVMGSLTIAMLLYVMIQTVIIASGADLANSEQPLAVAATHIFGPWGGTLMAVGATISMMGFCAGIAFSGPRYITVLCEDGFLPKAGARLHPRYETPYIAIVVISLTTIGLVLFFDFAQMVDLAGFAVTLQYLFTALAVPFLRRKVINTPDSQPFRLPGGVIIPVLAVLVSLLFLVQVRGTEFKWSLIAILFGLIVSQLYRRLRHLHR